MVMDVLVLNYQPDKYEAWMNGTDVGPRPAIIAGRLLKMTIFLDSTKKLILPATSQVEVEISRLSIENASLLKENARLSEQEKLLMMNQAHARDPQYVGLSDQEQLLMMNQVHARDPQNFELSDQEKLQTTHNPAEKSLAHPNLKHYTRNVHEKQRGAGKVDMGYRRNVCGKAFSSAYKLKDT